jgi:hypothetical protein
MVRLLLRRNHLLNDPFLLCDLLLEKQICGMFGDDGLKEISNGRSLSLLDEMFRRSWANGVLRFAQDDSKNKTAAATTADSYGMTNKETSNGSDKSNSRSLWDDK